MIAVPATRDTRGALSLLSRRPAPACADTRAQATPFPSPPRDRLLAAQLGGSAQGVGQPSGSPATPCLVSHEELQGGKDLPVHLRGPPRALPAPPSLPSGRALLPETLGSRGPLPALSGHRRWAVRWPRCPAARGGSVLVCTGSGRAPAGPGSGPSSPAWDAEGAVRTRRGCRSVAEGGTGQGGRAGPSLQAEPWRPDCPAEGKTAGWLDGWQARTVPPFESSQAGAGVSRSMAQTPWVGVGGSLT